MSKLTNGQKWLGVAFTVTALTLGITFFMDGDVRTFAYVVVGLLVAGFAIINGDQQEKRKKSE